MDMVDIATAVVIGGMFVFWVATTALVALIVYIYDWRAARAAAQHEREAAPAPSLLPPTSQHVGST